MSETMTPDIKPESTQVKKNLFTRCVDKLYGGINMSWVKVIILAVASALLSAVFLIIPIFEGTSFREMGATLEMWIFLALIIIINCKKPLEAALKTFVFFLISQPLIYLFQVPFSYMGWRLFMYYGTWFIWTLFTFPMAFAGWYVKKGNWLSLLLITPVNLLLAYMGLGFIWNHLVPGFPSHLISIILCFGQIALYLFVLFRKWAPRLVGVSVPAVMLILLLIFMPTVDTSVNMPMPDDVKLSDSAVVTMADDSYGEASLDTDGDYSYIEVHMKKYGEVMLTVTDGDKEYYYIASVVYENGHSHIDLQPYYGDTQTDDTQTDTDN